MTIVLKDVTEEVVDRLEDAFINLVNVHTYTWGGITTGVYEYEICVNEDTTMLNGRNYELEHVSVLYKNGSYMIEIMNARQVSTVEIKAKEVLSVVML